MGGGWSISVQRLTPSPDKHGVRAFINRVGDAVTCRNNIVISNSHLQSVISGLTSIILVVLGTVNHHFQGALVPISLPSILGIVAAQVLGTVWVIMSLTFPPGGLVHRKWLRILSTALEKELKVLGLIITLLLFSLLRLFSFVSPFLTSLTKLTL